MREFLIRALKALFTNTESTLQHQTTQKDHSSEQLSESYSENNGQDPQKLYGLDKRPASRAASVDSGSIHSSEDEEDQVLTAQMAGGYERLLSQSSATLNPGAEAKRPSSTTSHDSGSLGGEDEEFHWDPEKFAREQKDISETKIKNKASFATASSAQAQAQGWNYQGQFITPDTPGVVKCQHEYYMISEKLKNQLQGISMLKAFENALTNSDRGYAIKFSDPGIKRFKENGSNILTIQLKPSGGGGGLTGKSDFRLLANPDGIIGNVKDEKGKFFKLYVFDNLGKGIGRSHGK